MPELLREVDALTEDEGVTWDGEVDVLTDEEVVAVTAEALSGL